MVILAMLFGMALLAMGICYIFSLLAKAAGKEKGYQLFAQVAQKIYWRLLLCGIVFLIIYLIFA